MLTSVRTATLIAAAALATTSCTASGSGAGSNLPPWVGSAAAVVRLVTYDSCEQVLGALIDSVKDQVGPYGLGGGPAWAAAEAPSSDGVAGAPALPAAPLPAGPPGARNAAGDAAAGAPGAAPGFSGTNVHEAGVDEPDLVKTDGRRLLTVTDGVLRVVDVAGQRLVGELKLDSQSWPDQILLAGDHVLLIARGAMYAMDDAVMSGVAPDVAVSRPSMTRMPVGTELTVVDVSGSPRVLSTIQLQGDYVDARQIGSIVRVVLRSYPQLPFVYPDENRSERGAARENRGILQHSTLADWLPAYKQTTGGASKTGELVDCDAVHHVRDTPATSMLTVTSLDLSGDVQLSSADSVSVATGGETVYGTGSALYVAEGSFGSVRPLPAAAEDVTGSSLDEADLQRTRIHKFDITGNGRPRYVASGSVPGFLINQYAMSEYQGALRVATTLDRVQTGPCCDPMAAQSESAVTVLGQAGDRLVPVGAVDGLGKGERIYSVRFVGPVGYVVTFRQTDPLYTIDLSNPQRPQVVGELKINGYSAYLHPAGDGKLIGVGQDATSEGQVKGTQVSLFDVSNPAEPRRLANYHLSGASSEAEFDPHAFLYWPADQTIVVPVQGPYQTVTSDEYVVSGGALVLRVNGTEIDEIGLLSHQTDRTATPDYYVDASIRRAVVIGNSLWTVSSAGALVSDLTTLDGQQWIPYPQAVPKGSPTPAPEPQPLPWPVPEPLPIDPPSR